MLNFLRHKIAAMFTGSYICERTDREIKIGFKFSGYISDEIWEDVPLIGFRRPWWMAASHMDYSTGYRYFAVPPLNKILAAYYSFQRWLWSPLPSTEADQLIGKRMIEARNAGYAHGHAVAVREAEEEMALVTKASDVYRIASIEWNKLAERNRNSAELHHQEEQAQTAKLKECRRIMRANGIGHIYPGANWRIEVDREHAGANSEDKIQHERLNAVSRAEISGYREQANNWQTYATRLEHSMSANGFPIPDEHRPAAVDAALNDIESALLLTEMKAEGITIDGNVIPISKRQKPALPIGAPAVIRMDDVKSSDIPVEEAVLQYTKSLISVLHAHDIKDFYQVTVNGEALPDSDMSWLFQDTARRNFDISAITAKANRKQ